MAMPTKIMVIRHAEKPDDKHKGVTSHGDEDNELFARRLIPASNFSLAQVGVEPTASLGLSKGGLPIAYRANHFSSGGWSRTNIRGFRARCPTS